MARSSGLRIPRMALLTLTLGAACGSDDDGGGGAGGSSGVDTSAKRISAVARALCEQTKKCGDDSAFDVDDCVELYAADANDLIKTDGASCGDAVLDAYACYAKLGCTDDGDSCDDLFSKAESLCPSLREDDDDGT